MDFNNRATSNWFNTELNEFYESNNMSWLPVIARD